MELRKLIDALPALREIAGQRLPMRTLYKVTRTMQAIQPQLDFYDTQYRMLVKDYCVEQNGEYVLDESRVAEFTERLNELQNLDVDLNIKPMRLIEGETEYLKLSYNDICSLEGIIEIDFLEIEDERGEMNENITDKNTRKNRSI
jgi:hypothetical protein